MFRRLHIADLDVTVDDQELKRLFATAGTVSLAQVVKSPATGLSTGAGLVEMTLEKENAVAIALLNGREHRGHRLVVRYASSRDETDADHTSMFGPMNVMDEEAEPENPAPRSQRPRDLCGDASSRQVL